MYFQINSEMEVTFIILGILAVGMGVMVFRFFIRMKQIKSVHESEKIKKLTDQNFKNQIRNGLVLVDFWASWCMPCKLMVPVLNELAEDPDNKAMIAKLNVDEQRSTASKFGIRSIPTCVLFNNGKEVERIVGVKTADQLRRQINKYRERNGEMVK